MQLILAPDIQDSKISFNEMMSLTGKRYREVEGRCTQRIVIQQRGYFLKTHRGVGWKEIFKNLFQLRLPVLSAKTEWRALQRLAALGIPSPEIVGFGCRGKNPATLESFLLTRELPLHASLEDFCRPWKMIPPRFTLKRGLILAVASIAKRLHEHGINHRDFYICHFLLDIETFSKQTALKLYLIDLHRAQIRKKVPTRWLIKDLAGLYFSSREIGLSYRDLLRFLKAYRGLTLRDIVKKEAAFWQKVKHRGETLYQKHAT